MGEKEQEQFSKEIEQTINKYPNLKLNEIIGILEQWQFILMLESVENQEGDEEDN